MRHRTLLVAAVALSLPLFSGGVRAQGDDNDDDINTLRRAFRASLVGDNEVPPISTTAVGSVRFTVHTTPPSLDFRLTYTGLSSPITQSHVHFGPSKVNGGVMFYMCSNLPSPPPGTLACPGTTAGTVSGTITMASVVGPTGQGISAGDFDKALRAIGDGLGYANIHTMTFPTGEIRGQVR